VTQKDINFYKIFLIDINFIHYCCLCTFITGEDVSEDESEPMQKATVKKKRWYRFIKPKTHYDSHTNIKRSKGIVCVRILNTYILIDA